MPEVRRLLWHLVWEQPPSAEAVEHWSVWRRRHQQRARECHWRKRTRRRRKPRLYDWAYLPYRMPPVPGWKTGLLIRRRKGRPHQFTFYLTRSPEETSLAELVRIAGQRWRIESCFEEAKGETGLDEYEVRSWTGWHRHITLSMLAHAYLSIVRRHAIGGRGPRRAGRAAAAAHCAGGATAALASGVGAAAFA